MLGGWAEMNGTGKQSLVSSKKAEECNKRESSYLCCVSRYVYRKLFWTLFKIILTDILNSPNSKIRPLVSEKCCCTKYHYKYIYKKTEVNNFCFSSLIRCILAFVVALWISLETHSECCYYLLPSWFLSFFY